MLVYFCFCAVIFSVKSASAPFITPCPNNDSACIKASGQAAVPVVASGVPELGIKPLDPMKLALIKGDQGGLKLTFKDTTITGLKGCVIEAIKSDISKGKQQVTIRCSVTLQGNYKLGGQLLVLPIQGEGKYTIKIHKMVGHLYNVRSYALRSPTRLPSVVVMDIPPQWRGYVQQWTKDIIIKASTELSTVNGVEGKPHLKITSWKHTYQVKTGTQFNFDNLFNGNKVLSQPVHEFANTNWRDVMSEIASPIVHAIVAAVVDAIEALYNAVPAEQLYVA